MKLLSRVIATCIAGQLLSCNIQERISCSLSYQTVEDAFYKVYYEQLNTNKMKGTDYSSKSMQTVEYN